MDKGSRMKCSSSTIETFHPNYEWSVEGSNHLLTIHLPGFNRKDFSVQVDNTGKLIAKGKKNNLLLDETYIVPEDAESKKVTGRFEDGCLTLIMPKKPVLEKKPSLIIQGAKQKLQEQQEAPPPLDDHKKTVEKEKDSTVQDHEKKKKSEERQKVVASQEKIISPPNEKKSEERDQKETPPESTITPPQDEKKKIEEKEKRAADENGKEKKRDQEGTQDHPDELASKKNIIEEKKEELVMSDKIKNGVLGAKRKFREEGWFDHGMIDCLLETINNNKKVIIITAVAFSVGFYVSHKLRLRSTGN